MTSSTKREIAFFDCNVDHLPILLAGIRTDRELDKVEAENALLKRLIVRTRREITELRRRVTNSRDA